MAENLERTVTALEALIAEAGGVDRLITPRGWPHLGLVVLDAVFSLQADYDTVVQPLLERYCDAAPDITWATASMPPPPEHDARRLLEFLEPMTLDQRCQLLTSQVGPGTAKGGQAGYRKAQMVVDVARILVDTGAATRATFVAAVASDTGLEWKVRRVPGVGFACWKYMLNLSGLEASKPDTMVLRWLCETTGAEQTQQAGASLIEQATAVLQRGGAPVTVRQMDHLVWRKVTGRPLGTDPR
ncbi:MAG: hypothetical protein FGM29_03105 [Actinobacteria bacterium]|nr:hypothetical protein [Actinomycetota bacterium]